MTDNDEINELVKLQADRIAELEKQLDTRTRELIGASFYEHDYKTLMANSEPVAWLWINNGITYNALLRNPMCDEKSKEHWSKKGWSSEPLYTTPQTKPLSDEEICKLFNEHTGLGVNQKEALEADLIVFARAIEERHGIK